MYVTHSTKRTHIKLIKEVFTRSAVILSSVDLRYSLVPVDCWQIVVRQRNKKKHEGQDDDKITAWMTMSTFCLSLWVISTFTITQVHTGKEKTSQKYM